MMVLVDTSVWIDHFRTSNDELVHLLNAGSVVCHPLIIGELACGRLQNRQEIFSLLHALPRAAMITHREVLFFIEQHSIMGKGIGIVDIHILASAKYMGIPVHTQDRRLASVAGELGLNPN